MNISKIQNNIQRLELKKYTKQQLLESLQIDSKIKKNEYAQTLKLLELYCNYQIINENIIINSFTNYQIDLTYEQDISQKLAIDEETRHLSGIYLIYAYLEGKTIAYVGVSGEIESRYHAHSNNDGCKGYQLLRYFKDAKMDWLYLSPVYLTDKDLRGLETYLINQFNQPNIILLNDSQVNSSKVDEQDLGMVRNSELMWLMGIDDEFNLNDMSPLTSKLKGDYWSLFKDIERGVGQIELYRVYNRNNFIKGLKINEVKKYQMTLKDFDDNIISILEWLGYDICVIKHPYQWHDKHYYAKQEWSINSQQLNVA